MNNDELLTVQELSDYLKVRKETILKMINTNEIVATKVGRDWRIFKSDVIKYLKRNSSNKLKSVKKDGDTIQYIYNPSERVQLEAVKQNGLAIQYIVNPSEEVQLEAVKQNGLAIQYIDNPSEEAQLLAKI